MWGSLQYSGWVTAVSDTPWLYAAVSVTHYFTMFFCIGTASLLDLRVMGVADRNQSISRLADQIIPWTWAGFALAILSGFVLFATDATEYVPNNLFWLKIAMILVAVVVTIIVQTSVPKWSRLSTVPAGAKILALFSLLFWLSTILVAVDISYISGIG